MNEIRGFRESLFTVPWVTDASEIRSSGLPVIFLSHDVTPRGVKGYSFADTTYSVWYNTAPDTRGTDRLAGSTRKRRARGGEAGGFFPVVVVVLATRKITRGGRRGTHTHPHHKRER